MGAHQIDIHRVLAIALEAGKAVMQVYESDDFDTTLKDDRSPLTRADKVSHQIIDEGLRRLDPSIPILSEEGKEMPYEERQAWERFWLVDPLDGTKEFIKKNGEYTVNIGLIEAGSPVMGVVHAPALGRTYYGAAGKGAFRMIGEGNPERIAAAADGRSGIVAVGSRSHSAPEEEAFLSQFNVVERASMGSSLKFCLVAEGRAHVYYRHGPTWEWDTAAGHAVVSAAGGRVDGLAYNKPVLLNGSFTCASPAIALKG